MIERETVGTHEGIENIKCNFCESPADIWAASELTRNKSIHFCPNCYMWRRRLLLRRLQEDLFYEGADDTKSY